MKRRFFFQRSTPKGSLWERTPWENPSDKQGFLEVPSFNTDLSKIDKALLRKGRMIARYEFQELSTDKAKKLSEKLGFTNEITAPMTLASIYNQDEQNFEEPKNANIGFRSQLVVNKK